MNPKTGGGKASYATANSSPNGKIVTPQSGHSSGGSGVGSSPNADQLIHDVAELSIGTPQDAGWEVVSKKNKNRRGTNTRTGGGWQAQTADFHGSTAGRGTKKFQSSDRVGETSYKAPPPVVSPPLKQGSSPFEMNSKKGVAKASYAAIPNALPKGKSVTPHFGHSSGVSCVANSSKADQLFHDVAELSIDTAQAAGWEVFPKKNKNRGGTSAPIQWGSTGGGNTRVHGGARQGKPAGFHGSTAGRGTQKVQSSYRGRKWNSRLNASDNIHAQGDVDDDLVEDIDDDLLSDFDSDDTAKSHGTRKQHKWFKEFFEVLDKLTVEEISEPSRKFHCPACINGPGAIDLYQGLQPLMAHAKGEKREKVHRELAEILDEELSRRGLSAITSGVGKWRGLQETVCHRKIVWPPIVMVRNTVLRTDDNGKWIGMGNQELLDYFSAYNAVKARHSYGPEGHRGISLLIFENTAIGYMEAECLHKHFAEQRTDRDQWDRWNRGIMVLPGKKRQLYGYMAKEEDMAIFNQHCEGETKLEFEMRTHHEMVVIPMKQMVEELVRLNKKFAEEKKTSKALRNSYGQVVEKLRVVVDENRIVRERTKMQATENNEEMKSQVEFFELQIKKIFYQDSEQQKRAYEDQLQEESNAMQQTIKQLQEECKDLQQTIDNIYEASEVHRAYEELVLQQEHNKMQQIIEQLQEERNEMQQTIKQLQEECNAMQQTINNMYETSEQMQRAYEALVLQEERKKVQQSIVDSSANEELRQVKITALIQTDQTQAKGIEEFEAESENAYKSRKRRRPG